MKKKYVVSLLSALVALLIVPIYATTPPQPVVDFTQIAEQALPAIVSIRSEFRNIRSQYDEENLRPKDPLNSFSDEFFQRFFGVPPQGRGKGRQQPQYPNQIQVGLGTGFVVSDDGVILTNSHLVKDADKVTVTLQAGKEFDATIVGADPTTDLAILKIDNTDMPFLALGNSDALKIGEWVVAIGNPLGLQSSLTVGVVSAKNRGNLDIASYEDFIQTDAAINVGNSGGPLLNLAGKVIGINTAIISNNSGGYMGIGFAIPSAMAERVMEQLLETGTVTRGFLGVMLQGISSDIAEAFSLDSVHGALVTDVVKDSPAERAGLQRGDIILKYNDMVIETPISLRNSIALVKPNTSMRILIKRGSKTSEVSVTIGEHPDSIREKTIPAFQQRIGIEVESLTEEIAQQLGYIEESGIIVTSVIPGSAGALAGIQRGTLIISANHNKISDAQEFYKELKKSEESEKLLLLIKHGEATRYVFLKAK